MGFEISPFKKPHTCKELKMLGDILKVTDFEIKQTERVELKPATRNT